MMWANPDRWTCPSCVRTVTIVGGTDEDASAAIQAIQRVHGKQHQHERWLEARVRRLPVRRVG